MKTILFFIQNFARPAGSERVTSIIASELAKAGNRVMILSICGSNESYYDIPKDVEKYTLINKHEVDNRRSFFKILNELNHFYKTHPIDICVDVMPSLSIYTIILKKKYCFKNITWEHFNYKINTGMCWYGRKIAMLFSNRIITLTETDKRFYCIGGCRQSKIDYIYNPSPYQNGSIHNFNNKNIISVGRLNNQKGFDRLIKVWAIIEKKTDWVLYIYGDGEDKNQLLSLVSDLGLKRIHFMGAVRDIEAKYANSNIYISTARYEGLPMTMIEAQSFGIPIISFDYDTGPKDIIKDGFDGFLINNGDEDTMIHEAAEKTLLLISNPTLLNNMSKNAYSRSRRFNVGPIMQKWNSILDIK